MRFSRQEYWSGLPFPSPGDLPHPGIEPGSLALQTLSRLSYEGSPKVEIMFLLQSYQSLICDSVENVKADVCKRN